MRFRSAAVVAVLTGVGVLAVPISAQAAPGTTYYAAPGALGNCMTVSTPCSLSTAFNDAESGTNNLVSLADGTYAPSASLNVTKAVTLEAGSGATPEIDGDGSDPIVDDSAALTISGLTLDGGDVAVLVETTGTLNFSDSTASDSSDNGLTVYGTATVTGSTLKNNDEDGVSVSGTATVTGTTSSGNGGDGIGVTSVNASSPIATITESTSYDNGGNGLAVGDGGAASIYSSSLVSNTEHDLDTVGAGTIKAGGDLIAETQSTGGNCGSDAVATNLTDAGFNISDDNTCPLSGASVVSDPSALDPSIGAFDDYGGPARTLTISQASPAADVVTGTPTGASAICGTPDQRGLIRPAAPCAAGSFDPHAATVHSTTTEQVSANAANGTMTIVATITGSVGPSSGGTVDFQAERDGGAAADVPGCTAVPVSDGSATCRATVTPVHGYQFIATFSGSLTYSSSVSALSTSVRALETSLTTLTVDSSNHVTATVTRANSADPANAPTGTVSISVGAAPATAVSLTASNATTSTAGLTLSTSLSNPTTISAAYHGDSNFAPSSGSTATKRPTLVPHLTSSRPKSKYGWYHTVVVVNWTCAPGTGTLVSCPTPTTLSASKAKESTRKTIFNSIGGSATATSPAVNIDRIKPTVRITGVRRGHTYSKHAKVHVRCSAKDSPSGLAGKCRVKITHKRSGKRTAYLATVTATDKAGNRTVKTIGWKRKR